jgi:hypothetical protein
VDKTRQDKRNIKTAKQKMKKMQLTATDTKEPSLEEIDAERKTIEDLIAKLRKTKKPVTT